MILEQVNQDSTPLTSFLRIYERKGFQKVHDLTREGLLNSHLAYILLEGCHEDRQGKEVDDMACASEITEKVKSA